MPLGRANTSHPAARRAYFSLLYLSEGAPIGYVWWAMPTRLRQAGMPVEEVAALTALLTLPWALKFLWAPAIDRLRGPRWGYRAWITVAQIVMGLTLVPLAFFDAERLVAAAAFLLVAHAFAAATQDVGIDAMAIATIPHAERGGVTGWMQAGMLVGRATFGGLALAAERWIGADMVIFSLVGCIWLALVVLWLFPMGEIGPVRPDASPQPLAHEIKTVLARRTTWIGFGIALTAGAGFEAVGGLIGPLMTDRGASQESIGWFFAIPVVVLMIVGGLIGGVASDRLGHRRLVISSVLAVALCVLVIVTADTVLELRGPALMAAASPLYLCIGSLTAASYALFMDLTDPAIGGTQFSAYMGATNLCEVWAIALAGTIAGTWSYAGGFVACAAVSLLAIVLVWRLGARSVPGRA